MSAPAADKNLAKRLGLGRVAYLLWFKPRGIVREWTRLGVGTKMAMARGENAMYDAAERLEQMVWSGEELSRAPAIHFLTGKRFWAQTAFCAWTLMKHSGRPFRVMLYDDGSFDEETMALFEKVFPKAVHFIRQPEIEDRLNEHLPVEKYPTLRARRIVYPNLRKLTDIHVGQKGWQLVLDSDMLFWAKPDELVSWLEQPDLPMVMRDVENSYGYEQSNLKRLCGEEIPDRLNVGICGLKSEEVDFDQLEDWNRRLIEEYGCSYYEEQALVAMMLAGKDCLFVPESTYICMPSKNQVASGEGILHHYVADSKIHYFTTGWEKAASGGLKT